jgi:hypothetical protein
MRLLLLAVQMLAERALLRLLPGQPELGRVGLSEREARAAGVRYRLATNQALLRLDPMAPTLAFLLADAIWGGASH